MRIIVNQRTCLMSSNCLVHVGWVLEWRACPLTIQNDPSHLVLGFSSIQLNQMRANWPISCIAGTHLGDLCPSCEPCPFPLNQIGYRTDWPINQWLDVEGTYMNDPEPLFWLWVVIYVQCWSIKELYDYKFAMICWS